MRCQSWSNDRQGQATRLALSSGLEPPLNPEKPMTLLAVYYIRLAPFSCQEWRNRLTSAARNPTTTMSIAITDTHAPDDRNAAIPLDPPADIATKTAHRSIASTADTARLATKASATLSPPRANNMRKPHTMIDRSTPRFDAVSPPFSTRACITNMTIPAIRVSVPPPRRFRDGARCAFILPCCGPA